MIKPKVRNIKRLVSVLLFITITFSFLPLLVQANTSLHNTFKQNIPTISAASDISIEECDRGENCPTKNYTDITDVDSKLHNYIDYAVRKELMIGVSDTAFLPGGSMTRAMVVTVLWRLEGSPEPEGSGYFTDVEKGAWFEKQINWARENGVVKGTSDTTFDPNSSITNQQMTTILYSFSKHMGLDVNYKADISNITDYTKRQDYAKNPMLWTLSKCIFAGKENTNGIMLDPFGDVTRAQFVEVIVKYIYKTIKYKEDGVLKILTIGNSFSDDAMEYAVDIAKNLGIENVYFGNIYGSTLDSIVFNTAKYEYRVNTGDGWTTTYNHKIKDILESQNWDFVSLQQASGYSGIAETYEDLDAIVANIRNFVGYDTQLSWHMTWAYQSDSTLWEFTTYDKDQMKMYNAILDCVQSIIVSSNNPDVSSMRIIPNGTAIQNARTSYIGDHLTRDGYHLTYQAGRYIAALTLIHALTGLSIDNVDFEPVDPDAEYYGGVSQYNADYIEVAIESAKNAVLNPFEITPSVHKK